MSIILGLHNRDGRPLVEHELSDLASPTAVYAPSGFLFRVKMNIGMAIQPNYTHERSTLGSQPVLTPNGDMLLFDGRLDNYEDLADQLQLSAPRATDCNLVLSAFERWSSDCFSRFVGDWALALWSNDERSLYLARDHAGTRTLYFEQTKGRILWSTHLETFFLGGRKRGLHRGYAACYLTGQPLRDRTPYQDICAVPPAHYLRIQADSIVRRAYWHSTIDERLSYRFEHNYDEQFIELFARSVARRAGPGAPVLAELSGGMDSSSIVCMADRVHRMNGSSGGLLDTLSFYDKQEPAWDEKPFFSVVERHRGKVGLHIDLSRFALTYEPLSLSSGLPLLPGLDSGTCNFQRELDEGLGDTHRAILSGIGGDELLGGVPNGLPELADLLASRDFRSLLSRSMLWCLVDRSPLVFMLFRTARFKAELCRQRAARLMREPHWVSQPARSLCEPEGADDRSRVCRLGLSPSTVDNDNTWRVLLETLPHLFPSPFIRREYRYPFLDRDLVEFLFRVPRHILLNPGNRRTMMRRAMKGIVPAEIIERRRKAYVARRPLASIQTQQEKLQALFAAPRLADYGLVNTEALRSVLQSAANGREVSCLSLLMKSISLELWLRSEPTPLSA